MKLYKINNENLWSLINVDFGNDGGIYKVVWIKENKPKTISRFIHSDNHGVLYIGKAQVFLDRVINLKKSLLPKYKSDNHDFGNRYNNTSILKENIPLDELFIELTSSINPELKETEELEKYYKTYGELPPFNFKI